MITSATTAEIAKALAKAQSEMGHAVFDKTNPHFKNKYASFGAIWDAAKGPLTANGIAVVQGAEGEGNTVKITTTLFHSSGEWIASTLTLTAEKANPQAMGSALSYGKRYGMAAMCGVIADEDDDGEAATNTRPASRPSPRPQQPQRDEPEPPDFPAESARTAADAMRKAIDQMGPPPGIDHKGKESAINRKANVLAYMEGEYGPVSYRKKMKEILGKSFPVNEEILLTMADLEKLEDHMFGKENNRPAEN